MNYEKYPPPASLRNYVRYFWSFDSRQPASSKIYIRSFADRYPRLIFQDLEAFEPICTLHGDKLPVCYLSGIDTKNTEAVMGGTFSHFGVSFYPHALNVFFKIDASELTNEMPDIRLICNSEIQNQLLRARSHRERAHFMSIYLYNKIHSSSIQDPLINHLIGCNEVHETAAIFDLTRKYKISERQLQRKFKTSVGISVKKLQRIARFEKTLQLLQHADYTQLTAIAHQLDYTDQSHFIKDFKAFSGMTPYAFAKKQNFGSESSSFLYC